MISWARRRLRRLRDIGAEIDYAQQRLFEIRTGILLTPETERALARAEIARLEAQYAMAAPTRKAGRDPRDTGPGPVRGWSLEPAVRR